MNYNFLFTVVNGTTHESPSRLNMHIAKGTIIQAGIYFPILANDTVNIQIDHHGSQILPANPDGYYFGDQTLPTFPDCIPITQAPYILQARGWNTSGADVVVGINITVVPEILSIPVEAR